jgi:hypothetical protein
MVQISDLQVETMIITYTVIVIKHPLNDRLVAVAVAWSHPDQRCCSFKNIQHVYCPAATGRLPCQDMAGLDY